MPTRNHFARLTSSPKHHPADPALAASLLGIDEKTLLSGEEGGVRIVSVGTLLWHLFESLVTQSVRVYAQAAEATVKHFRTMGGRNEVDLIVERNDQKVVAIEVKLKRSVDEDDVKKLLWLKDKMNNDLIEMLLINTGPEAYRRKDGVAVVPASLLGA